MVFLDRWFDCFSFHPNTLVKLDNGDIKPISEIEGGDILEK